MVRHATAAAAAALLFATAAACGPVRIPSNNASSSNASSTNAGTACASGVKMIVARGSKEPAGFGAMVSVVDAVSGLIPGSSADPVAYPALMATEVIYAASVINGTAQMSAMIADYAAACPDGKIVLLGYSQGAQVVADTLCGRSSAGFPPSSDLGAKDASNIIASVIFGDPTRAANQTWNTGNITTHNGVFPRLDNAACAPYGAGLKSWCDAGDKYCDAGHNPLTHHVYFEKYTTDAANWVLSRYKALSA